MAYRKNREANNDVALGTLLTGLGLGISVISNVSQASDIEALKNQLAAERASTANLLQANNTLAEERDTLSWDVTALRHEVQKLTEELRASRAEASQVQQKYESEKIAHGETQKKAKADIAQLHGDLARAKAAHAQAQADLVQAQAQVAELKKAAQVPPPGLETPKA